MEESSKHRAWILQQSEEQRTARKRMALFPDAAEVFFVASDIWVVSILDCNAETPDQSLIPTSPSSNYREEERPFRLQVFTV
jgi:hypothetical protein